METKLAKKKKTYEGYKKKTAKESQKQEALNLLRGRYINSNLAYEQPIPLADLIDEMEREGIVFGAPKSVFLGIARHIADEHNWNGVWRVNRNRYIKTGDEGFAAAVAAERKKHLDTASMALALQTKTLASFSVIFDQLLEILLGRMETMENAQLLKFTQLILSNNNKIIERAKDVAPGEDGSSEMQQLLLSLSAMLGGQTGRVIKQAVEQAAIGHSQSNAVIDVATLSEEESERKMLFKKQDEDVKRNKKA